MLRTQLARVMAVTAMSLCLSSCDACAEIFSSFNKTSTGGFVISQVFFGYAVRCENGRLQEYYVGGDGTMAPNGASYPSKDCGGFSINDDARPNNFSDVFNLPPFSPGSPTPPRATSPATVQPQVQDEYSLLSPFPFVPAFPASTLASYSPSCTPGTSFYVVNHSDGAVTHYSLCPSLSEVKRIDVGSNPLQLAVTPDSKTLVVTRYDNAVVFIDTATDVITSTLSTGTMNPSGIAISPDGARAYVTNYFITNPAVMVIDMATRQITGTIPTAPFPKSIFLTPDGSQAWVTFYQSSTISIIDTLTQTVSATVNVGGVADTGLAFNPAGTRGYVATRPNQLIAIDTATLDRVASITVGSAPADVVVTPEGSRVFVNSSSSPVVSVVDATTNTLIRNAPVTGPGMALTLFH